MAIQFHTIRGVRLSVDGFRRPLSAWIRASAAAEGFEVGELSVIFCGDDYLLQLNRDFLQHDYLTDIITFDYRSAGKSLSGDLFISVDRVRDNSIRHKTLFHVELLRVIIHGVMHLAGYADKTKAEKEQMRRTEDRYLEQLPEVLIDWRP